MYNISPKNITKLIERKGLNVFRGEPDKLPNFYNFEYWFRKSFNNYLIQKEIPLYVRSVLIREYKRKLSEHEIIEFDTMQTNEGNGFEKMVYRILEKTNRKFLIEQLKDKL